MINRKIAFSVISILSALALMGGATFAYFSDTSTATNNSFTTGNADLKIATDPMADPLTDYVDNIAGFSDTGLFPGYSKDYKFWLRDASTAAIGLDNTVKVTGLTGNVTLQSEITLGFSCTRGGDSVVTTVPDTTLASLSVTPASLNSLLPGDLTANGGGTDEALCTMTVKVPTTSTVTSDSVGFNLVFDATQTP
ncbi:MAG: hypothetical protein UY21_C0001G0088 [Microgenomates group bacterium GW2011_GWA1_48_10]|nr:MAG: hypothetical protein UY21_C0001G0088 [Microgenomates group bacterium GW2011_GWA1_48_10]